MEQHVPPAVGGIGLQDLDADRLDRPYANHGGRPLAAEMVTSVHVVCRKAHPDATRKRLVTRNLAIEADPPEVRKDQASGRWHADF